MGKIIGIRSRTGRVQLPLKYRVRLLPFERYMEFLYQVYIVITKFTIIIILIFNLPPWDPPWWPPGRPWWPPGRPCPRLCWSSVSSGSPEDSSVVQTNTRAPIILFIQYILFCCWSELLLGNIPHICTFFNFTTLRWCMSCARTGMTQSLIVGFVVDLNCCNSLRRKTIRDMQLHKQSQASARKTGPMYTKMK